MTLPRLPLSPAAKEAWVSFHDAIERELRAGGELYDVRDVASKAADNAARLAALFHVFDHDADGAVAQESFEAASRIVAWHLNESRRFFGELALPAELAGAAQMDRWLLEYCQQRQTGAVPRRDIQRLVTPATLRRKDAFCAALRELAEAGRIREVATGSRKVVQVNPLLLGGGTE